MSGHGGYSDKVRITRLAVSVIVESLGLWTISVL